MVPPGGDWDIRLSRRAMRDKAKLEQAGLWTGVLDMLRALGKNSWHTPPPFEKLKGDLAGLLSRRITYTHRLVYEVDAERRLVKVLSFWTHCE